MKFHTTTSVIGENRNGEDYEIELMEESNTATSTAYIARKRGSDGKLLYAHVWYDERSHQFRAGEWFANGFTAAAIEYVAQWKRRM